LKEALLLQCPSSRPLNYLGCDIRRLTQIFGRPLSLKYRYKESDQREPQRSQIELYDEEGNLIGNPVDEPEQDFKQEEVFDLHAQMEDGFEEEQGFGDVRVSP
jgi:hypothetical protein